MCAAKRQYRWALIASVWAGGRIGDAAASELLHLDPSNTQISFTVRHLGVRWMEARFDDLAGTVLVDPTGSASQVDVSISMESLICDDRLWNARLRSAAGLDVQRFPRMSFHSTHIQYDAQGDATVHGQLTLHGLTHEVDLLSQRWHCDARKTSSHSCSFQAFAQIKRSDYGLPHGLWAGGDEVGIRIQSTQVRIEPLSPSH